MDRLPFDRAPASPSTRLVLLALWAVAAGFLVARHVVWRDEVRSLTLALVGDDPVAMLRGLQGEGHPALWYLMLRAGHAIARVPQVLPAIGAIVGFAAAGLFAWRAPFRGGVVALVLFSGSVLVEYTAIARSYGIAMLLMFALAALPRGRGVVEGMLLAALANTSVPAVLFAGAWLLFRVVETGSAHCWRPSRAWWPVAVAGALAAIGVALCFVTVFPPVNDAAMPPHRGIDPVAVATAMVAVSQAMYSLVPPGLAGVPGIAAILAILLFASPLALIRTPAGFVAALAALLGCGLFFGILYPGSYRHHALYIAFIVALLWATAEGRGGHWGLSTSHLARPASWALVALLVLQLPVSAVALVRAVEGRPYSHSADLAAILKRPEYARAIVVTAPDYLAEPLAYYGDWPTWLVRERRFGKTVRYTRHLIVDLSLGQVLADAQRLHAITRRPVVLAIRPDLDRQEATHEGDGYVTTFSTTPAEVRAFEAATVRIARFADAETDENFTVYRLRPSRARQ